MYTERSFWANWGKVTQSKLANTPLNIYTMINENICTSCHFNPPNVRTKSTPLYVHMSKSINVKRT